MIRKKGSALVLAIFMLMFLMAVTLNMYFLTEKRAELTTIRQKGAKNLGLAETGAALGVYDYKLARTEINNLAGLNPGLLIDFYDFYHSNIDKSLTPPVITQINFDTTDNPSTARNEKESVGNYILNSSSTNSEVIMEKELFFPEELVFKIEKMQFKLTYTENRVGGVIDGNPSLVVERQ